MSEANKALLRRLHEAIDRQDESAVGELVAADLLVHVAGMPDMDLAGWTQMRAMFWGAFPDLRDDFDDMISEGDKVVGRLTLRGTHKAEFQGIPATGKSVEVQAIGIFRVESGKVVEEWAVIDTVGLLQQLGAFP